MLLLFRLKVWFIYNTIILKAIWRIAIVYDFEKCSDFQIRVNFTIFDIVYRMASK